jgi:hypothetical protein
MMPSTPAARLLTSLEATLRTFRAAPKEHDFGSFEADGQTIFFKIDYFDPTYFCVAANRHRRQNRRRFHNEQSDTGQ